MTRAEKETSVFLYKHVTTENNCMFSACISDLETCRKRYYESVLPFWHFNQKKRQLYTPIRLSMLKKNDGSV